MQRPTPTILFGTEQVGLHNAFTPAMNGPSPMIQVPIDPLTSYITTLATPHGIPQSVIESSVANLQKQGIYSVELLKELSDDDLKPLLGLGLFTCFKKTISSEKVGSSTPKTPKHGSTKKQMSDEEKLNQMRLDLKKLCEELNQDEKTFTIISLDKVFCQICSHELKLQRIGYLGRLARHINGQKTGSTTYHTRRCLKKDEIPTPKTPKKSKSGSKSTPKRKKAHPTDIKRHQHFAQTGTLLCWCLKPLFEQFATDQNNEKCYSCRDCGFFQWSVDIPKHFADIAADGLNPEEMHDDPNPIINGNNNNNPQTSMPMPPVGNPTLLDPNQTLSGLVHGLEHIHPQPMMVTTVVTNPQNIVNTTTTSPMVLQQ